MKPLKLAKNYKKNDKWKYGRTQILQKTSYQKLKDDNGYLHRPSKTFDVWNVSQTLQHMLELSKKRGYDNHSWNEILNLYSQKLFFFLLHIVFVSPCKCFNSYTNTVLPSFSHENTGLLYIMSDKMSFANFFWYAQNSSQSINIYVFKNSRKFFSP